MPSEKSHRAAERKALQNQRVRGTYRTARRKASQAAAQSSPEAGALVKQAVAELDRAARRHIIHPNKAARAKSQLMRALKPAARPV